MARKRVTLPKDFRAHGDPYTVEELAQVFSVCVIDARGGYAKAVALAMDSVDLDGVRWLLDQGADLEAEDQFGASPLTARAARGAADVVRLLLDAGADPVRSRSRKKPLHQAAENLHVDVVALLLAAGVDVRATADYQKRTALDAAMIRFDKPHDAVRALAMARLLVSRGAKLGKEPRSYLRKTMGTAQRFARAGNLAPEQLEALTELLAMFGVEPPAPPRELSPGEPITVTATGWKGQYSELWQMLVPGSGPAETVQGETVRIAGRIGHEILNNGGGNWDPDFEQMLDAYERHVQTGAPLSEPDLARVREAVSALRGGAFVPDAIDDLTELAVAWVMANPALTDLPAADYRR